MIFKEIYFLNQTSPNVKQLCIRHMYVFLTCASEINQ